MLIFALMTKLKFGINYSVFYSLAMRFVQKELLLGDQWVLKPKLVQTKTTLFFTAVFFAFGIFLQMLKDQLLDCLYFVEVPWTFSIGRPHSLYSRTPILSIYFFFHIKNSRRNASIRIRLESNSICETSCKSKLSVLIESRC